MNTKSSIIVLIVVILIGGIIYVSGKGGGSGGTTSNKQVATIENSKQQLMKRVDTVSETPLTEKEKIIIFQSLSSENSAKYGFTQAEKAKVIEALNK
ncbi:MAG: hypothetical protein Q7R64_03080 [bacterium]|nr:hypothetical protein [bacterium]